jgi:hypothetical protein
MASTDAKLLPIKNTAYRVTFPLLDADGDLVAAATGLDSEVSKDGGTFVDCTNEATEIATGSGIYYLDLTATEMNADTTAVIIKTTSSGAKTTALVMYPLEAGDIFVNVTQWAGNATATGNIALKNTLAKTTDVTGFNDLSAAQVNTEADTALADVGLTSTVSGRIDVAVSSRSTYAGADTPGTTTLLTRVPGAITVTGGKVDVNDKTGFALTAAYDPAKTAATQASVNAIDTVTDKLNTMLEIDGGVYRYTTNSLEQSPVSGGGTDWTSGERDQIRHRLGIDGTKTAPATLPSLAMPGDAMTLTAAYDPAKNAASQSSVNLVSTVTNRLDTALEADGGVFRYTANALEQAPSGGGGEGGTDWSDTEREQIRYRLGLDGTSSLPPLAQSHLDDSPGVTTLLSRIGPVLFSGISSLGQWLGLIAGKQIANSVARTEIRATGSGSGTYDESTDSLEAIRIRGDAAWVGGGTTPPPSADPASACFENPARTTGPTTEPAAFAQTYGRRTKARVKTPCL